MACNLMTRLYTILPSLLALVSASVVVAFGLWLSGALVTAWFGQYLASLPQALSILLLCLGAMLGGGLWAACAAVLRNTRGVNEVISTIMLNFIAAGLVSYCVHGPLMEAGAQYPQTDPLPSSAQLPRLFPPTRIRVGVILAVLAALFMQAFLCYTKEGLKLRAAGANPIAARFAGFSAERQILFAFVISGALSGFAGGIEVSGVTQRVYEKFSPGYGFTAIAVALVGQRSPLGVIAVAIFFGVLEASVPNWA